MKYHLKWISALLALLVLLAADALAETGADGEGAAYATILQADALPEETETAEPASTADAPEVPGAETAVPGVRVEFHIYYGEETGASLTEYSGGTYPIVLENLAPGSAIEAPALPGSLIVNGAEYAPSDSAWKSSGTMRASSTRISGGRCWFSASGSFRGGIRVSAWKLSIKPRAWTPASVRLQPLMSGRQPSTASSPS